jgi:hypothetical protein
LIILAPPVNKNFTLGTVFPLMLVDFLLIYACVRLAFKFASTRSETGSPN